jgi:hypothetical protein
MSVPSALEHHDDEFAARNAFLHLMLGLAAAGARVEALTEAPSPEGSPLDARDERFVDAVVGFVAFARDLRARLDDAARAAPEAPPDEPRRGGRVPLR